jgi:proteic killer suppression protein
VNSIFIVRQIWVEIAFRTKKLERCYVDYEYGRRTWGTAVAKKFVQRIDLLQEAANMLEVERLPGLNCHPLKGGREGQYGVSLHGRWRLAFTLKGNKAEIILIEEVSKHYGD